MKAILVIIGLLLLAAIPSMPARGEETVTETRRVLPYQDVGTGQDFQYIGPTTLGLTDHGKHYLATTQPNDPDQNDSYTTGSVNNNVKAIGLYFGDLSFPDETTIDSVTVMMQVRKNQSGAGTNGALQLYAPIGGTACGVAWPSLSPYITEPFSTFSKTFSVSCNGDLWQVSDMRGVWTYFSIEASGVGTRAYTVSWMALDISYTYVTDSHASLRAPIPDCAYNRISGAFDCIDVQDYYNMNVVNVTWRLDGGANIITPPNGRVSFYPSESLWSPSITHTIYAVATYISGTELSTFIHIDSDHIISPILSILIVSICVLLLLANRRQRR